MKSSVVFEQKNLETIENNIKNLLNGYDEFKSIRVIASPRAVGDIVQEILEEKMDSCFPKGVIKDFSGNFARRAMADVAFTDVNDYYYVADIKTHNKDTNFNMPNLTSVKRLADLYEDDRNSFIIVLAEYKVHGDGIIFDRVSLFPIEHLKWECLTIGALGWGQIQIANARKVLIDRNQKRKDWMLKLCDSLAVFYPKEVEKILNERVNFFSNVRVSWAEKQD